MSLKRKLFGKKPTKGRELSGAIQHGTIYRTCLNCLERYPDGATVCESCGAKLEVLDKEARYRMQLITALKHTDSQVREQAATALGELGDAEALGPLIAALRDSNSRVREQAARAIEQLDSCLDDWQRVKVALTTKRPELAVELGSAAVEPLIAALKDSDSTVRGHAAKALEQLDNCMEDRQRVEIAMTTKKLASARVEPLIAALTDSRSHVRGQAAVDLGKLGDARAVEPLIAALTDWDGKVRGRAAVALGKLGDARAVQPLIAELRSPYSKIREQAALALGMTGDGRAVEPLIAASKGPDSRVREQAAIALSRITDAREVEPLIAALNGSDSKIREQAAVALGKLGDARAVGPLITALKDSDSQVRGQAAKAIEQLDSCMDDRQRVELAMATKRPDLAVKLGGAGVEPLIAALKDANYKVREQAAVALGKLGDGRAVEPLIAALTDTDYAIREQAAVALGKLGDGRAVEPLIASLEDSDSRVRVQAAKAIEQLDSCLEDRHRVEIALTTKQPEQSVELGSAAVEPLIAALNAPRSDVREQAATALGRIGDARAVGPLIAALKDSDSQVRAQAAKAIGELDSDLDDWQRVEVAMTIKRPELAVELGSAGVEPLIAALKDSDPYVREQSAIALGVIGDARAVEPLIAALKRTESRVREQAAIALGVIGDARAVEPLIAVLKYTVRRVREQAAIALGKLGDARAVGPLIAALKDPDSQVRGQAVKAIERLDRYLDGWQRVELAMITKRPELAVKAGSAGVEPLIVALDDPDWDVTATIALGKIGDARAVESLIVALRGSSSATREQAAIALGKIGDGRTLEPLVAAIRDSESKVRKQATISLRKIDNAQAIRLLIDSLQVHQRRIVQNRVAEALSTLGHEVLPFKWPALAFQPHGNRVVSVENPNNFQVRVGLRSGNSGKDFVVPPFQTGAVNVPPGSYKVFFQYATDPLRLLQGNDIQLESTTAQVQISIVRSPDGNYAIRPV